MSDWPAFRILERQRRKELRGQVYEQIHWHRFPFWAHCRLHQWIKALFSAEPPSSPTISLNTWCPRQPLLLKVITIEQVLSVSRTPVSRWARPHPRCSRWQLLRTPLHPALEARPSSLLQRHLRSSAALPPGGLWKGCSSSAPGPLWAAVNAPELPVGPGGGCTSPETTALLLPWPVLLPSLPDKSGAQEAQSQALLLGKLAQDKQQQA